MKHAQWTVCVCVCVVCVFRHCVVCLGEGHQGMNDLAAGSRRIGWMRGLRDGYGDFSVDLCDQRVPTTRHLRQNEKLRLQYVHSI